MQALIYQGVAKKGLEQRPIPTINEASDAIIKITKTTICGTDLHILKGDVPSCQIGRVLGHEGTGIIEQIGSNVRSLKVGDHVLISCITSCGICDFCRKSMYSHCETGGWLLGNRIDGTQAEYVRIPHADTSLYKIPTNIIDEEAFVMLSDIFPTGFECGVLNGKIQPGNTVGIIGAGPIGLATLVTAQFYSPSIIIMIDIDDHRLQFAKKFGANFTINSGKENVTEKIMELTQGKGVDTAIEAVGVPATFNLCEDIIAAGGTIANIGVHGMKVDLHLERLWSHNITITTRLVDTVTTPMLLKTVQSKTINPTLLITHRFKMKDILEAYQTFESASNSGALKVIIQL